MKKFKAIVLTLALAAFGLGDAYLIARETTKDSSAQFTAKKRCTNCNGTGKVDERVPCYNCSGDGCGICDWYGYRTVKVDCSYCDGTGWIVTSRH